MPATYEKIATTTLGTNQLAITFNSIAASWTDLRLVLTFTGDVTSSYPRLTFNNDTATNYSRTVLDGDGTSALSSRSTSQSSILCITTDNSTTIPNLVMIDIFSYAGSTNKTALISSNQDMNGSGRVASIVGLWRSTAAITRLDLTANGNNFKTGTTATLYGILKA